MSIQRLARIASCLARPAYPGGAVRVVGDKGWNKSLMHHKFLVGLDEIGEAKWVVNGSFDMTEVATSNIENLMIIEDEDLSQCYLDEFKRVYSVSKPLKINVLFDPYDFHISPIQPTYSYD